MAQLGPVIVGQYLLDALDGCVFTPAISFPAEQYVLPKEIDEDRISDVAVVFHHLFVHGHNQNRVARTVTRPRFQDGVVKVIGAGGGGVRMPKLALRVDVVMNICKVGIVCSFPMRLDL